MVRRQRFVAIAEQVAPNRRPATGKADALFHDHAQQPADVEACSAQDCMQTGQYWIGVNSQTHPIAYDPSHLLHERARILVPAFSSTRSLMVESSTKARHVAELRLDQPGCQRLRDNSLPATKGHKGSEEISQLEQTF